MDKKPMHEAHEIITLAMKDFSTVVEFYSAKNPQATAAALLAVTRHFYAKANGAETAAMMFYRLADELAPLVSKKKF
jgi:hypothetical protein